MKKNSSRLAVFPLLFTMACGASSTSADLTDTSTTATNQDGFALFEGSVFKEQDTGVYIVNGDTPVENLKQLEEFYEQYVKNGELIVHQVNGVDSKWTAEQRKALTYCVSTKFNANYDAVVQAMQAATAAWEAIGDVKFIHVQDKDASCTKATDGVVFDVNPVNVFGQYIARAFFPYQDRATRNVLIDNSAFGSNEDPTLAGVLRHELGHTLGFRHEHTRPESGTCFEDANWRALTPYDQASVMHYPQCNGISSWALELSAKDKDGIVALYGAPGSVDNGGGDNGGGNNGGGDNGGQPAPTPTTITFDGTVAKRKTNDLGGAIALAPGSKFEVVMTGSGDPDLYVGFDAVPTTTKYTCRPYKSGPSETCTLDVPAAGATAFIAVRGYKAGSYHVEVTYTPAQ